MFRHLKRVLCFFYLVIFLTALACKTKNSEGPHVRAELQKIELAPIQGKDVSLLAKKSSAELVIVNLWASWCQPCRQEFPDLLKVRAMEATRNVVFHFISLDFESDVNDAKSFLREMKVDFPSFIRTGDDQSFLDGLDPSWKGALPATYIFNREGKILHRFDGPVTANQLEAVIDLLKKQGSTKGH
jgi:thiol-disulfide isomerase/thioredoxin